MDVVFTVVPVKCLLSRFSTLLLGPRPDDSVNDLTVISTLGINTLSVVVTVPSKIRFWTAMTALSTYSLIMSAMIVSKSC